MPQRRPLPGPRIVANRPAVAYTPPAPTEFDLGRRGTAKMVKFRGEIILSKPLLQAAYDFLCLWASRGSRARGRSHSKLAAAALAVASATNAGRESRACCFSAVS